MAENRYFADADQRRAFIAGLRALADFLDEHPDVPAPKYPLPVDVPTAGTDEQIVTAVVEAARAMGVEPKLEARGHHLLASASFGPVTYQVTGVSRQDHAEFELRVRLGREAFERLRDRALVDAEDGECVDAPELEPVRPELTAAVAS